MITPTYTKELSLLKDYRHIAGIDEVGRGPLAGPVVSAVVILNPEKVGKYRSRGKWWQGIRDSKSLSGRQRVQAQSFIKDNALDFGIGWATHLEIDELNIHYASLLSMKRAIENLKIVPEIILVDGRFQIPFDFAHSASSSWPRGRGRIAQEAILDGDAHVLSIAAASILAKVYRDDLMKKFAGQFSDYGFEKHKGYDTLFHRKRLLEYGPCEIHRMSFETVREIISIRFRKMLE
jgi:ribonuclease HII